MTSRGRVLIVDDEEGIRTLCRVNLELDGYDVVEAADGEAAVEVARKERPDVIFLDVMMPKKDGWAVLEELKSDASTASIPVVLLTARTSEEDQLRAWGGGIFEYLSKPFNPQTLVDWTERAMVPRDAQADESRRLRALEQLKLLRGLRRTR